MGSFLFIFPKIQFDIMNALCKEERVLINVYELKCCAVKDLLVAKNDDLCDVTACWSRVTQAQRTREDLIQWDED